MKSVITCDMEGRVLTMNDDAEKVFGYKKSEIIGKKRVSIFSPGEIVLQNVGEWLSKANKFGEFVTKTYFLKKDGTKVNARIRISPTFANGKSNPQTGYCGITIPIKEEVFVKINFLTKIIKFLAVTRMPFTSASLFPVLCVGSYYSALGNNLFSISSFILCIFGILLLHLGANVYNDYFDVKDGTDEANTEYFNSGGLPNLLKKFSAQISGGSRAIELGLINLNQTKILANLFIFCSFIFGLFIFYNSYLITGSFNNVIGALSIGFIGLLLGYFYTARPIRLSSRNGLGELSIFLAFGPLLTLGTAFAISSESIYLYSDAFYHFLFFGFPMGLLTTNILFINQFPDAESDAKTGKNNLVVSLGKENSRWLYLIFLSLAFISSFFMLNIFDNNIINFRSDIFIMGLLILYGFGLYINYRLFYDYKSRELIRSNVNTIVLQSVFCIFYIILFYL